MRFEARELKPYGEPVEPDDLREEEVYFSVQFADAELLIPMLEPLVFIGRNLENGDTELAANRTLLYFQRFESYSVGVRYDAAADDHADDFHVRGPEDVKHIYEYERALDVLLGCSLRRRNR